MKNLRLITIYNQGLFQQDQYGHSGVKKLSQIEATQVDGFRPNFLPFHFQQNIVADETTYI